MRKKKVFVNLSYTGYKVVRMACESLGFEVTDSSTKNILFWVDSGGTAEFLSSLRPWQITNHFPGMFAIARKVDMIRNLEKMRTFLPDVYNFYPRSFIVPSQFTEFRSFMNSYKNELSNNNNININNNTNNKNNNSNNYTNCNNSNNCNNNNNLNFNNNNNNNNNNNSDNNNNNNDNDNNDNQNNNNNNNNSNDGVCTMIVKPDRGSLGRGIMIVQNPNEIENYTDLAIAQEYISPFLVDGLKFDFRIYALVTSVDPLQIYIFEEGIARFCTEKYEEPNASNLANAYLHLTNYSLNKHNENFEKDPVKGHKRAMSSIFKYVAERGFDLTRLKNRIEEIIRLTIASIQPFLSNSYRSSVTINDGKSRCFELLGFDIMLDKRCEPWLLEVNYMPMLDVDTQLDKELKMSLMDGILRIVNLKPNFKKQVLLRQKIETMKRIAGTPSMSSAINSNLNTNRENHIKNVNNSSNSKTNNLSKDKRNKSAEQIQTKSSNDLSINNDSKTNGQNCISSDNIKFSENDDYLEHENSFIGEIDSNDESNMNSLKNLDNYNNEIILDENELKDNNNTNDNITNIKNKENKDNIDNKDKNNKKLNKKGSKKSSTNNKSGKNNKINSKSISKNEYLPANSSNSNINIVLFDQQKEFEIAKKETKWKLIFPFVPSFVTEEERRQSRMDDALDIVRNQAQSMMTMFSSTKSFCARQRATTEQLNNNPNLFMNNNLNFNNSNNSNNSTTMNSNQNKRPTTSKYYNNLNTRSAPKTPNIGNRKKNNILFHKNYRNINIDFGNSNDNDNNNNNNNNDVNMNTNLIQMVPDPISIESKSARLKPNLNSNSGYNSDNSANNIKGINSLNKLINNSASVRSNFENKELAKNGSLSNDAQFYKICSPLNAQFAAVPPHFIDRKEEREREITLLNRSKLMANLAMKTAVEKLIENTGSDGKRTKGQQQQIQQCTNGDAAKIALKMRVDSMLKQTKMAKRIAKPTVSVHQIGLN